MNYGLPYKGSKSKILKTLAPIFPPAENFYDLFGGGFSVTDYLLRHRASSFKEFHFNEIKPDVCNLIKRAINGEYNYSHYKPKWVTREEFKASSDAMVKLIWSFGNNGRSYMFGENIENYKKSLHNCVVFNEFDAVAINLLGINVFPLDVVGIKERRLFVRRILCLQQQPKQLERLEQLERLQRLQRLEGLEGLHFYSCDYKNIEIKPNSVVYCDIPYKNSEGYRIKFSHEEFFDWAASQTVPVFISEYEITDERFTLITEIKTTCIFSANGKTQSSLERLYGNKHAIKILGEIE